MRIRPANIADIDRCELLDGAYVTNYVWQMDEVVAGDVISMQLKRMRLPRQAEISYPREPKHLYEDWQRSECFLVASELATILGYLDITVSRWQWAGHIEHLIVDRDHRRQGIATRLLEAAEHWARGSGLTRLTVGIQTKNDPAFCLFTKLGYSFRGLVDHHYTNGDAAMFYSLDL